MPGSLDGLHVLDLSRVLAGPWCAQLLGDLGADVIKVERPGRGDDTRSWGPPWVEGSNPPLATYYLAANRNKRSLALNLHTTQGQAIAKQLIARSDVVIENYKTRDLQRFGLDHETMLREHPRLVWCTITGFGTTGPNAQRPGYDFMIQAESGHMSITGEPGGRPLRAGVAVADLTTGMMAATSILAALRHRDATGQGQHIDMSLWDVATSWLANQGTSWLDGGALPTRMGNQHPSIVPYQDFATATDPIALAVGNDTQFAAFAQLAGETWHQDPAYATSAARAANRAALVPLVEAALRQRPAADWLEALAAANVPAGPINTIQQALASDQARHRGTVVTQSHPQLGETRTIATAAALTATPPTYRRPPPALGEHTQEILTELGLTPPDITRLRETNAIG